VKLGRPFYLSSTSKQVSERKLDLNCFLVRLQSAYQHIQSLVLLFIQEQVKAFKIRLRYVRAYAACGATSSRGSIPARSGRQWQKQKEPDWIHFTNYSSLLIFLVPLERLTAKPAAFSLFLRDVFSDLEESSCS
jgi:hypothetical protein